MKNQKRAPFQRILSLVMALAMILTLIPVSAIAADTDTTLYLKPNANWQIDGARFAAYFFGNGEKWVSMTDEDGDGYYECEAPEGYPSVIFCRMNPNAADNSWNNKWNQTADLTVPTDGTNCYTVADGTWDNGGGTWSSYTPPLTLYLKPNANWQIDGARFAAYFFGNGEKWVSMTDEDGDGYYECEAPEGYPSVIFCRMNPNAADNSWNNKWNQTADLTVPTDGTNCYTVADGTWDNGGGTWSVYPPATEDLEPSEPTADYFIAGTADLCGAGWDPAHADNQMDYIGNGVYQKVYNNVPAGNHEFKVTDGTWSNCWPINENYAFTLSEDSHVTITFNENTKEITVDTEAVAVEPAADYYLVGWLNNADYSGDDYKFENGSLVVTFSADSYIAVKSSANSDWYMTDGWLGNTVTSAVLSTSYANGDKLFVPGNVELTFTLVENGDGTLTLSYTKKEAAVTEYYLYGWVNGADITSNTHQFVDGTLTFSFSQESYVFIKDNSGASYMTDGWLGNTVTSAVLGTSYANGDKLYIPAGEYALSLTEHNDGTLTLSYAAVGSGEPNPTPVDYYLVGYLNSVDNYGTDYKFVNGKLTATFTADTYVCVNDSNGNTYMSESYCTDTSVTLKLGASEKMKVPTGTELEFTLVENGDGTLTLSYASVIDVPEVPDGYNTVTIHFLKPGTWGSTINAWVWDASGALPGYELYNTAWPGSPIPANTDKSGWYDLVIGTENPQSFNFIFNDGSNQTADLTTGEVTGPTELWVVDGTVYTTAPREWTHYTATIHFQKPANWGSNVNVYAWNDGGELMGGWPGTVTSASANAGWYNSLIYVEVGSTLNFIFNDGNGNQTADLTAGKLTGNSELWIDGSGNAMSKPAGWVDENRTIHLPGTLGGNNWNAAGNQMEYDAQRGLYTITFEAVTPGTYEYKIAINGGWAENYGAGGEPNGDNMSVSVTTKQDVTFWYNDSTHRVVCSVDYDIDSDITLSGTGIAEGTKLTDPDLDGLYEVTVTLPAGTHSDLTITYGNVVVAFNPFTLNSAKDVTFYFDPATGMAYHNGSDVKVETDNIYYNTKDLDYKDPFGAVAAGEEVTFAITTGTDATGVVLAIRGLPSVKMEKDGEAVDGVQRWTCTTTFPTVGQYKYYFAITNGSDMVFYCDDTWNEYYKTGDYGEGGIGNPSDIFAYDLVVYKAGYETPDWMKNAVIYQIFPDRFFDADTTNNQDQTWARGEVDYEYITDWYLLPENPELAADPNYPENAHNGDGEWSNEIYGGDLKGITERIDYLKALGVNVIYLNPVFWSISNHRYDAVDYSKIDPILGTLGDFEELVRIAEENDMHIILDGVFNHVSDDSVYFDRYYKYLTAEDFDGKIGAYPYWAYVYDYMAENDASQSAAETAAKAYFSENYGVTDWSYTEWFAVSSTTTASVDNIGLRAGKYVYSYEGWWGYDSMPVIYSTNGSEYQTGNWAEQIIDGEDSINGYWISKGMDGWRLDVANEVSDETWQHFRDSVKALDSEAVIIGEIWSDATRYLMGDMYDSVMNYIFRDAVTGFARGDLINRDDKTQYYDTDLTADEAMTILEILRERYPEEAFYAMMNLVASHDTSRLLSFLDGVEDDRYQKDIEHAFPTYEGTSDEAKQLQYVVSFLQFTYAGAPTIYYGDEIGMVGGDDPDDRRAFTWGKGNQDIVEWYAMMAAIRAAYPALRTGAVAPFSTGNDDVMGFVRSDDANTLVVMANRAASDKTIAYEGTWVDLISGEVFTGTVTVPAYRGVILVAADEVKNITVNYGDLAPAYDADYIVATEGREHTSHNHVPTVTPPTCTDEGYTTYTCECGDSYVADFVPETGHDYDTVVTPPTCTEKGYTTYTCECGDSYVADFVPETGHDYDEGVCKDCDAKDPDYKPESGDVPPTGDSFPAAMMVLVLLASLTMLTILMFNRKKLIP